MPMHRTGDPMSNKSNTPARSKAASTAAAEHEHDHEDDLIVAPKGANRLRFILTLALVLFVLVMFVVADLFQYVVGGRGGGGNNPTVMTWRDPISGEDELADARSFDLTKRLLSQLAAMGVYQPDSLLFGEQQSQRRAPDVTEADVTSFLVYEDLAEDASVAVSQAEHVDFLRASFGTSAVIVRTARDFGLTPKELEAGIIRVRRVEKLKDLIRSGTRLADPDVMIERWQEQHPQHRMQYVALTGEDFNAAAAEAPPDDEALLAWWHGRPQSEQVTLYSEEKTVPQVAWLDLDGSFDATALLEAFPRPDGTDEEQAAKQYYDLYRSVRFLNPTPKPPEGTNPDQDATDDGAGDSLYQEFEAVRDAALRESKIELSLRDLIGDLRTRANGGEAIDLAVEAAKYGLESFTAPDAMTKAEMTATPGWGNQNLAQRLGTGAVGQMLGAPVIDGTRMYLGRVIERSKREELPLDKIRPSVLKNWTKERALVLATERFDALVAAMAEKPADHVEGTPWNPVVDEETFNRVVTEAGYTVQTRDWHEQRDIPGGDFNALAPGERFLYSEAFEAYMLPEGAVAAPKRARVGDTVYLVHHAGQRLKPADELKSKDIATLPSTVRFGALSDFGKEVFLGDSPWFVLRYNVRYPEQERRAAEDKAKGAAPATGAGDEQNS